MALQGSGQIKLSEIQTEFGGSAPTALSEYYDAASGIPASGEIQLVVHLKLMVKIIAIYCILLYSLGNVKLPANLRLFLLNLHFAYVYAILVASFQFQNHIR